MKSNHKPVLNLEQSYQQLQQLVAEFESGKISLDQAVVKFKEAVTLAKHLKKELARIETQIEEIGLEFDDAQPARSD